MKGRSTAFRVLDADPAPVEPFRPVAYFGAREETRGLSPTDHLWMIHKELQENKAASDAAAAERSRWEAIYFTESARQENRFLWIVGLYITTVVALAIYISSILR